MTKPMRRVLICGALALAAALAGDPLLSPLSASSMVVSAPASFCVAPDVGSAGIVASHDRCARERRHERRMCRRYGIVSWQCLNAYIKTAKCEGRYVTSRPVTTSMGAVRGAGLLRSKPVLTGTRH